MLLRLAAIALFSLLPSCVVQAPTAEREAVQVAATPTPNPISTPQVAPPMRAAEEEPTITLPESVSGAEYAPIEIPAKTNGKIVRWFVVTPGLFMFPPDRQIDTLTAVVWGKTGTYRVAGYTALGDVPSKPQFCTVYSGVVPPVPPEPKPPGPNPPDPPTPPLIPEDEFGNVGRAVSVVVSAYSPASKIPIAKIATSYRRSAGYLEDGTLVSIDAAAGAVAADVKASLTPEWATFSETVTASWRKCGPLDKAKAIRFLSCVATGLEAVR